MIKSTKMKKKKPSYLDPLDKVKMDHPVRIAKPSSPDITEITKTVLPKRVPEIQEPTVSAVKVVAAQEGEQEQPASTSTSEENDNAKIRRSTRIKKLETSRGGARRREVVFSNSDRESIASRSFDQEDDSNSNSNSGSGISTSVSVPNLCNLNITSPHGEGGPASGTGAGQASPGNNSSLAAQHAKNLISKPGYILADSTDTELMDKLKKFDGIEENLFFTERYISKEGRGMVCDCFLTREEIARGDIGCNEDCLNRLLMVECGNRCPTGDRCTNKNFQRKQYCGLEVFRTEKKGHGLRTTQALPEGGFVIEYVGEVLDPREFKQRTREYAKGNQEHFYFMALKSDSIIDATLKGNCSRFINHSCEPNCETQKWTVNGELRIGFFAIKDLDVGDEITFDYQFQRYGKKAQQCFCMAPLCRGWIGGENEEDEVVAKEPGKVRVKVERKKKRDTQWEDISFEEELLKLEISGLRNKIQTLNLCRLMVRAEDWDARERILNVLVGGEEPCRRLFLDYHGLRLLWAWMLNLPLPDPDSETLPIRNDRYHMMFLKTLGTLPIPNKTILQDSKVLPVIEKWSAAPPTSKIIIKKVKPEVSEVTASDLVLVELQPQPETEMSSLEEQFNNVEIQPTSTTSDNLDTNFIGLDPEPQSKFFHDYHYHDSDKMELDATTTTLVDIPIPKEELEEPIIQELTWEFVETAKELLQSWDDLKEVFRIPKKERVEQMKQHERAADISGGMSAFRRPSSSLSPLSSPYHRDIRQIKSRPERRIPSVDFSSHRDYHNRQHSRPVVLHPQSNLSKMERRHLFAAQVAREEEEERNRRMQDHMVILHQERCANLGLDVTTVPIVDPSCTYYLEPTSVTWKEIDLNDPTLPHELVLIVQASQLPSQHEETIDLLTPEPEFVFPPWPEGLPPPPPLPPSVLPRGWRMAVDDEGRCYYYDIRSRQAQWNPPSPASSTFNSDSSDSQSSEEDEDEIENENIAVLPTGEPIATINPEGPRLRLKVSDRSERRKKSGLVVERMISPRAEDEKPLISQKSIRSRKLQLMEQKIQQEALEAKGLGVYNEEIDAVGPFPVPETTPPLQGPGTTNTETTEEIDERNIGETATISEHTKIGKRDKAPGDSIKSGVTVTKLSSQSSVDDNKETSPVLPGFSPINSHDTSLANTSASSSPCTEISSLTTPTTFSASTDQDISLVRGNLSSTNLTPILSKLTAKKKAQRKNKKPEKKPDSLEKHRKVGSEKKGKSASIETFRSQIANVIVQHLNPYRKPKCKNGRITSTEDFKHLARKMTHAIALKELKHCRDGKTLVVNESVKHKTKEYVKKYMAKYNGRLYIKSPDDTPL